MRRGVYCVVLTVGLLMPAASASAHRGTTAKAGKYLAKVIRAADTKQAKTGKVRVTGCKAKSKSGRHRHSFGCRVSVRLTYPNGTSQTCTDRSVTVLRTKHSYRRVKRTYMNKHGFTCGKPTPLPPVKGPPPPPDPAGGEPPPVTTPPNAPPPGLPPFPARTGTSAKTAGARKLTIVPRTDFTYFNGFYWQFLRNGLYYQWFYDANGYAWLVEQWAFQGPGCRGDYRRFWWWSASGWTYYYQYWILDSYYGEDQILPSEPC
jgi:hypothetical protein